MSLLRETIRRIRKVGTRFGLVLSHEEKTTGMKGQIFIEAFERGEKVYSFASPNVIVNTASILVARLLKDSKEPVAGIAYLAVGTGEPGWNLQDPPAPTTSQTVLRAEVYRKPATETKFINPEDGSESNLPTNIVDYVFSFTESQAVGPLVELGLFGGDANSGSNTGSMVNYRTFPVLNKTNSMAFTIIVRITT